MVGIVYSFGYVYSKVSVVVVGISLEIDTFDGMKRTSKPILVCIFDILSIVSIGFDIWDFEPFSFPTNSNFNGKLFSGSSNVLRARSSKSIDTVFKLEWV